MYTYHRQKQKRFWQLLFYLWVSILLLNCVASTSFAASPPDTSPIVSIDPSSILVHIDETPQESRGFPDSLLDETSKKWLSIENYLNKQQKSNQNIIWLKFPLPKGEWREPYIYLFYAPAYLEVYQNRQLVTKYGNARSLSETGISVRWEMFPVTMEGKEPEIYIKMYGKIPERIQIGNKDQLIQRMFTADAVRLIGNTGFLVIAMLSFLFYLFNRQDKLSLLFTGFLFSLSMAGLIRLESRQLVLDTPSLINALHMVNNILGPTFFILFFAQIFSPTYKAIAQKIGYGYILLSGLATTVMMVWAKVFGVMAPIMNILLIFSLLSVVVLMVLSLQKEKNKELLLSILGVFFFFAINISGQFIKGIQAESGFDFGLIASYALVIACASVIMRRYIEVNRKVRDYADKLEEEVATRTRELETTHLRLVESMKESAVAMAENMALEERNQIAQEIHDIVGHTLTTTILQIEAGKRLMTHDPQKGVERMEIAQELVRKGLNEIRTSVRLLKEAEWNYDLRGALQKIIQETKTYADIEIEYDISELPEMAMLYKHTIYLALKEGLTNGLKHGGATQFSYRLSYEDHQRIHFELRNNGVPFEGRALGFGLKSMKDRIEYLQGTFRIYATSEWGCVLEFVIPHALPSSSA